MKNGMEERETPMAFVRVITKIMETMTIILKRAVWARNWKNDWIDY